ncbi:MAG: 4'-phosphopantetheinyl transferase family protein [Christensenellales bacterium]
MIIFYKFIATDEKPENRITDADKDINKNMLSDEFILSCYKKYCDFKGREIFPVEIERAGKPHFVGSSVRFNLSHSGNLIAVAFSESEVGLDVESYGRKIDDKLADYLFINKTNFKERVDEWTKLEACAKFDGVGLAGIRSIDTSKYRVKNINYFSEYSLAVCGYDEVRFQEIKE